ncbi:hypothetical protein E2562_039076 [Oryza meyeriana var. granulata]|uniref:Uncharacterized protein n=1 Tax=Oryza meyeriana var. granulata TaxID=110450 RepID=A0A6G1E9M7_9ORYZ|nr:hypothetical protein E2562_039076 [Oryza meyeriana var. granulata]
MVIDVEAAALGFLLVWRICRTVKTHVIVVEITTTMLSMSILRIDSDTSCEYIPNKVISLLGKVETVVTLRSSTVHKAGNQKLIPIPHSRTTSAGEERATRHGARVEAEPVGVVVPVAVRDDRRLLGQDVTEAPHVGRVVGAHHVARTVPLVVQCTWLTYILGSCSEGKLTVCPRPYSCRYDVASRAFMVAHEKLSSGVVWMARRVAATTFDTGGSGQETTLSLL